MNWHTKMIIGKDDKCYCPNCNSVFIFGPFFDHHKRQCLECKIELREWNMNRAIYLISTQHAPEIIKRIIPHLDALTEQDAYAELRKLEAMFGKE
jgi:hypothetical protein